MRKSLVAVVLLVMAACSRPAPHPLGLGTSNGRSPAARSPSLSPAKLHTSHSKDTSKAFCKSHRAWPVCDLNYTPSPIPSPVLPTHTPAPHTPAPKPPAPPITGFGAADAAWNLKHQADGRYAKGCCYFGPSGRYYAAQHDNGHVDTYEIGFTNEAIDFAKAMIVRNEFPADAQILSFTVKGQPGSYGACAQMVVQSSRVAQALNDSGKVLVEFSSGNGGATYKSESVNDAILMPWYGPFGC